MAKLTLPSTAKLQTRKSWQIQKFYGADYSNPKFLVEDYHAIDQKNFIRRDEALQKRYGYKQVYDFEDEDITIHNIFRFTNNGEEHFVANAGGSLYQIKQDKDTKRISFSSLSYNAVLDQKICAFPSNDRLYILGGKKYLVVTANKYGSLTVSEVVNSEYAYVPVTTIGITPIDLDYSKRTSLDSVNLLTYWRKNKLISGLHYTKESEEETKKTKINVVQEYPLDSPIRYRLVSDMKNFLVHIEFNDNDSTQFQYDQATALNEVDLKAVFCKGIDLYGIDEDHTESKLIKDENIDGIYILVHYADGDFKSSYESSIAKETITFSSSMAEEEMNFLVYGYVNLSGSIVLFNDYPNTNTENNITVTYPCYDEDTYKNNVIDKCCIGKVYNSNNINSLFVSGNSDYPARDWHTEELNVDGLTEEEAETITTKDLVYFPDTAYCDYGQDSKNPILGYDLLGTGDLLVLKKYQKYEPTIYFRTGQLVSVTDDSGNKVSDFVGSQLYKPEYSLTTGNIGKSVLNYDQIVNFNGDTLFIANDNTVQGLDKETKAYDNQRYANSRSTLIDVYLKKLDLTKAGFFYDEDFLYFYNKKEMFVNKYGEFSGDSSYVYEWYHLKYDVNITGIYNLFGDKYFSDDSGKLYLLFNEEEKSFVDKKVKQFSLGEVILKKGSKEIVFKNEYFEKINEGSILYLEGDYALEDLGVTATEDKDTKVLSFTTTRVIPSLNTVEYRGAVYSIERTGVNYEMTLKEGTPNSSSTDTKVYLRINQITLVNKDMTNKKFTTNFTFAADLTPYAYVSESKVVECYYVTSPILFDSSYNIYYKNIWSFMIADDTGNGSRISIDLVENRSNGRTSGTQTDVSYSSGFTLDDLTFEAYSLESNKIPVKTYTIFRNMFKKEYIALKFWNDSATNCVLSRINFTYSIGGVIR